MKALNVFLTAIILLVGLFFFTPICMTFGLPDGESNTALTWIGATTSTLAGSALTSISASKFYKWFNSHIK
jgi:hypothetical protein